MVCKLPPIFTLKKFLFFSKFQISTKRFIVLVDEDRELSTGLDWNQELDWNTHTDRTCTVTMSDLLCCDENLDRKSPDLWPERCKYMCHPIVRWMVFVFVVYIFFFNFLSHFLFSHIPPSIDELKITSLFVFFEKSKYLASESLYQTHLNYWRAIKKCPNGWTV